jgi:hypothetical protein
VALTSISTRYPRQSVAGSTRSAGLASSAAMTPIAGSPRVYR